MTKTRNHIAGPLILLITIFFSMSLFSTVAADTEKAKASFNEGLKLEKEGAIDGALIAYNACVSQDPTYVDAYINMGSIYFSKKDYENALQSFKKATENDSKNIDAFSNLGKVEYILKKYAEAEVSFKAAIAIKPSADLYKELGKVYYKKKNYKETISAFNSCHEAGGGDYMTYYMLGKSYQKTGSNTEAINALKASNSKQSNYLSHSTIGQIYLSQEKYNQAADAFKNALKADGKKYRAAYNYAVAVESSDPENYTVNIENWNNFINIAKGDQRAKNDVNVAKQHVKDLEEAKEKANLQ